MQDPYCPDCHNLIAGDRGAHGIPAPVSPPIQLTEPVFRSVPPVLLDPGMPLRDRYAWEAITKILAVHPEWLNAGPYLAERAWKLADAMLAARERKP